MYIPYKKTNVVYGLDVNYAKIMQHQKVVVFEAEKSVMQGMSFDMSLGVGVGGHNISPAQTKYIRMLNARETIVAFDQDLDEEEVRYEAQKLVIKDERFHNKVSYIYDRDGIYLPKGSKLSPSDLGRDCFVQLLKNCKHEVN
jgi:DNA primase